MDTVTDGPPRWIQLTYGPHQMDTVTDCPHQMDTVTDRFFFFFNVLSPHGVHHLRTMATEEVRSLVVIVGKLVRQY